MPLLSLSSGAVMNLELCSIAGAMGACAWDCAAALARASAISAFLASSVIAIGGGSGRELEREEACAVGAVGAWRGWM